MEKELATMTKKRSLRFVCALLAVLLCATLLTPWFASASTSTDKMNQLQNQLNQIKEHIASIKNEADRTQANIDSMEQQNALVKQQIQTLDEGIVTVQNLLAQKQADLDEQKRQIQETDALFQQRLRAMYVMHNSGALSTILGVNSFEELLTASTTLSRISISDTELLTRMAEEKARIEADEAYIQARLVELNDEMTQKEAKKAELAQNMKVADATLDDLSAQQKAEEASYSDTLAAYNSARAEAEAEMGQASGSTEFVGGEFGWPVPGYYYISSPYGWRTLYGKQDFHTGIDIAKGSAASIYGAPVTASLSGTVQKVKYGSTGYGYYVIIDHGGNYKTLYGHLSGIAVVEGQQVTQGQTIGYVGSTGNSTGPHLHFEIRVAGAQVDPQPYLKG